MIKLISYGYFDLIILTAVMDLINKMDKVNIRAFIKTTLLIPPTDTFFVASLLSFVSQYPNRYTNYCVHFNPGGGGWEEFNEHQLFFSCDSVKSKI